MELQLLLNQLDQLNLSLDQYVIVGSASMAAHGIREAKDLDVVPTLKLWDKLAKHYSITTYDPCALIRLDDIEFLGPGSMFLDNSIAPVPEMIQNADLFFNHPFLKLELLKEFKKSRGIPKDLRDIELIEEYLAQQKERDN